MSLHFVQQYKFANFLDQEDCHSELCSYESDASLERMSEITPAQSFSPKSAHGRSLKWTKQEKSSMRRTQRHSQHGALSQSSQVRSGLSSCRFSASGVSFRAAPEDATSMSRNKTPYKLNHGPYGRDTFNKFHKFLPKSIAKGERRPLSPPTEYTLASKGGTRGFGNQKYSVSQLPALSPKRGSINNRNINTGAFGSTTSIFGGGESSQTPQHSSVFQKPKLE